MPDFIATLPLQLAIVSRERLLREGRAVNNGQAGDADEPAVVAADEPVLVAEESFGLQDRFWTTDQWRDLLESLVDANFFSWKDVAILALGQANPPQVGTSIASKDNFKANHPLQNGVSTMQQVMGWLYAQQGRCVENACQSRLDLQVDHVEPIEDAVDDPASVDTLDNLVLRCRRHNVIRRKSHKLGGRTFLTTESALMWILLGIRPRSKADFDRMCRLYGMTMASVRMDEAWAMALWLAKEDEASYDIAAPDEAAAILLWPDKSLTRRRPNDPQPDQAEVLVDATTADQHLTFISRTSGTASRYRLHQALVSDLPFSHYELGDRAPNELCVLPQQPEADDLGNLRELPEMPPRGRQLIAWEVHSADRKVVAEYRALKGRVTKQFEPLARRSGRVIGDARDAEVAQLVFT
jgi:hypothetical protein